jgi:hypothetical protein
MLIHRLLSLDVDFVGAEMSRQAERVWRLLGLTTAIGPRTVYALRLDRARGDWLRAPGPRWTKRLRLMLAAAMRAVYPVTRALVARVVQRRSRAVRRTVFVEEVSRVPAEFDDAPPPDVPGGGSIRVAFHRGIEWLNWRLAHPWILRDRDVPPEVQGAAARYFFDVSRPLFTQRAFTFRSRATGAPVGYLLVSVSARARRETRVKVLDANRDLDPDLALGVALRVGREHGADVIVVSEQLGDRLGTTPLGQRMLERSVHEYVCRPRRGSALAEHADEIERSICDGDYSFT